MIPGAWFAAMITQEIITGTTEAVQNQSKKGML
jgi:hypothetical protein